MIRTLQKIWYLLQTYNLNYEFFIIALNYRLTNILAFHLLFHVWYSSYISYSPEFWIQFKSRLKFSDDSSRLLMFSCTNSSSRNKAIGFLLFTFFSFVFSILYIFLPSFSFISFSSSWSLSSTPYVDNDYFFFFNDVFADFGFLYYSRLKQYFSISSETSLSNARLHDRFFVFLGDFVASSVLKSIWENSAEFFLGKWSWSYFFPVSGRNLSC